MVTAFKFLGAVLILGGSVGALSALEERPGGRFAPLKYLMAAGLVAASWWFSRA